MQLYHPFEMRGSVADSRGIILEGNNRFTAAVCTALAHTEGRKSRNRNMCLCLRGEYAMFCHMQDGVQTGTRSQCCLLVAAVAVLTGSNDRTLLMAAVAMTTSSKSGTLPPTKPVFPPCRCKNGWWVPKYMQQELMMHVLFKIQCRKGCQHESKTRRCNGQTYTHEYVRHTSQNGSPEAQQQCDWHCNVGGFGKLGLSFVVSKPPCCFPHTCPSSP